MISNAVLLDCASFPWCQVSLVQFTQRNVHTGNTREVVRKVVRCMLTHNQSAFIYIHPVSPHVSSVSPAPSLCMCGRVGGVVRATG